ncbi:MAG: type I DNA topoisomerase [candidate division NC10 bacterium]|nr:type I DNA topoisomerase [candidate division NC10 bacterium]
MSNLVVVESPSKARTIHKILGSEYKVLASLGHLKDLPPDRLGVDEDSLEPDYVTVKGREKALREIRTAAKEAEKVFIATDPDREGEAIGWHLANEIKDRKDRIFRVLFHEITRKAVKEAMDRPGRLDERKVDAQQARRILDRLVGYKISPLLWRKAKAGLSAGRVQSVALRLICDREKEILAFSPSEYWTIEAQFIGKVPPPFPAKLIRIEGRKPEIPNEKEAQALLAELAGLPFAVKEVSRKEKRRHPVPPFTTSKLQQEAYRKLRFSSKRTMAVAQQLYEGIEIGEEGPTGLITYMRTDSVRVSMDSIQEARTWIDKRYGPEFLPAQPHWYKNVAGAQDAHEAIRPTSPSRDPESLRAHLNRDQLALYRLIWNRFLASQMNPEIREVTVVDIEGGRFLFRAIGTLRKFPGFSILYAEGKDEAPSSERAGEEEEEEEKEGVLPPLAVGERCSAREMRPEQHFTQPPPRFTEASLVKELEEKGIGRPSTYSVILSTLQERDYVFRERGHFRPTDLGMIITDLLVENFPKILDVQFTADMEKQLDEVEEGKDTGKRLVEKFYGEFREVLQRATSEMKSIRTLSLPTSETCEKCGKPMVIKWGRFGKFMACSGFPSCKNTIKLKEEEQGRARPSLPEASGEVCEKCGSPMVVREGRFGRYLGCQGFPSCKNTKPLVLNVKCPQDGCGGFLVEKRTRKGRTFYGCSRYPECRFTSWQKPELPPPERMG